MNEDKALPVDDATGDRRPPDLMEAIRRARLDDAQRSRTIDGLREGEFARLDLLNAQLGPVLAQLPESIDIFDHGIVPGERPRLYIDMLAFVDMERDRQTYRFSVDTRRGRIPVAQSERVEVIVAAVTDYVARRLVERERMLAESPMVEPADAAAAARAGELETAAATASRSPGRRFDGGDLVFTFILGLIGGAALFQGALWLLQWAPVARVLGP